MKDGQQTYDYEVKTPTKINKPRVLIQVNHQMLYAKHFVCDVWDGEFGDGYLVDTCIEGHEVDVPVKTTTKVTVS